MLGAKRSPGKRDRDDDEEEENEEDDTLKKKKPRKMTEKNKVAKPKEPPKYEEIPVTIEAPRYKPSGTIVLRGAKLITMRGDEIIPDGDIVVTDNRIAAIGKRGSATIPSGAKTIDVRGATIMPGTSLVPGSQCDECVMTIALPFTYD